MEVSLKVNKNARKSPNNTYLEDKNRKVEIKQKVKKESVRTNQIYNKVLKAFDVNDLESFEDFEEELFEQKPKIKK